MLSIDYKDRARFHLSLGIFLIFSGVLLFFSAFLVGYENLDKIDEDLDSVILYCQDENNNNSSSLNISNFCYNKEQRIKSKLDLLVDLGDFIKILIGICFILGLLNTFYGYYHLYQQEKSRGK